MDFSPGHLDLLLSRLFHDLISPIGAARNGLELLKEFGADDVGADAMDLAAHSTEQATDRLTFFRMAFGGAGSSAGHGFAEADRIARGYLASRRIEWAISGASGAPTPQTGTVKVLLGTVAVIADCLPRLGRVSASVGDGSVTVSGHGEGASLEGEIVRMLDGSAEARDERTVLAATVCANARRFGVKLAVDAVSPPTVSIGFGESS
ncbi:histidine phosphotransferase [Thalassobaculum fulvum]|uniref:Histidine phosphotransferase n=1 Tax=Thalassobaculum fulvum TaxID=1633335 RepID=A0A918XW48_9PROT|nr:histidine phosphotransferase family protein [Thalassobaculum fulvum]GHD60804.1 histidine phosphotransferase [Thalassobaculum fulvum]